MICQLFSGLYVICHLYQNLNPAWEELGCWGYWARQSLLIRIRYGRFRPQFSQKLTISGLNKKSSLTKAPGRVHLCDWSLKHIKPGSQGPFNRPNHRADIFSAAIYPNWKNRDKKLERAESIRFANLVRPVGSSIFDSTWSGPHPSLLLQSHLLFFGFIFFRFHLRDEALLVTAEEELLTKIHGCRKILSCSFCFWVFYVSRSYLVFWFKDRVLNFIVEIL